MDQQMSGGLALEEAPAPAVIFTVHGVAPTLAVERVQGVTSSWHLALGAMTNAEAIAMVQNIKPGSGVPVQQLPKAVDESRIEALVSDVAGLKISMTSLSSEMSSLNDGAVALAGRVSALETAPASVPTEPVVTPEG